MAGSFLAEVLKLRKRPATWIWGGIWLAFVVLFLYLLQALGLAALAASAPPEAQVGPELFSPLAPGNLAAYLLRFLFPSFGTAVAIILGSLAAGSEYGWGTFRVILSQRPGRLGVLSGKLLALLALLVLFVLVAFVAGILSSLVVALFSGVSAAPPPFVDLLESLGAGMLILVLWASLGFAIATLSKSTALAIGLGLIYAFAIEPVFTDLGSLSDSVQKIADFLPSNNTSSLSHSLASQDPVLGGAASSIDPVQSVFVMLAYTVVFILVATLVFRQRDVT